MNREDIIRMALDAGMAPFSFFVTTAHVEDLERFAALVAAAAKAEEREACAKLLDEMAAQDKRTNYYKVAANAIRARGETTSRNNT